MGPRARVACGALLVAIAIGGALAARLPSVALRLESFIAFDDGAGLVALSTFIAAQVAIATFGVLPASFAAVASGAAFGLVRGFFVAAVCILLGGFIAFVLARSLLRPLVARLVSRHPSFERFQADVASGGWKVVCLMRMSPVMPFALTSYGLGLTGVSYASFLAGMLASLPSMLCYVAIGALGKAGLAVGQSRLDVLHGIVLALGAVSTILLALRGAAWFRATLASAPAA